MQDCRFGSCETWNNLLPGPPQAIVYVLIQLKYSLLWVVLYISVFEYFKNVLIGILNMKVLLLPFFFSGVCVLDFIFFTEFIYFTNAYRELNIWVFLIKGSIYVQMCSLVDKYK